jgi:hypothetical protein
MEPTERIYNLTAKVVAFKKKVDDFDGTKATSYESLMVCLVPEHNDEFARFAAAWMPQALGEYTEIVTMVANHPVSPFARMSVHAGGDKNNALGVFQGPYLFVMTTGMAQYLARKKNGQRIAVKVVPEQNDDLADQAADAEGDFDLIAGQELMPGSVKPGNT